MKKMLLLLFLFIALIAQSQLLSWTPDFIKESSTPVVITMDANYGNKGLLNYTPTTDVYVHIGVITNKSTSSSDWKHVPFTWGTTTVAAQCTYLGSNKWKFTITGGLRTFFNVTDGTETIQKIAILFRSGNGNKKQANADGSDMYIPVYDNGVYARVDDPFKQPTYVPIIEPISKSVGDALNITAKQNTAGTLKIYFNGSLLNSTTAASLTVNTTIAVSGDQQIVAESNNGTTTKSDTVKFVVAPSNTVADLPAGTQDGINYEAGNTSVVLVLYAPGKKNVFAIGDFNNWSATASSLMNITPDSKRFWIRISGLTAGTEYAYQYLIDGNLKVADAYAEKVLDPDNDQYIPAATYPNLKAYPTGKTTGIVSILQTAKPAYNWQVTNFTKPNKSNLVIYELLVRDFVAAHNWQTLKDTLSYLKRLGVNAIEVMPFNEFEGNSSWGYNPSFYFAPDKYYGTETALKQFIDECHKQGMAIIMDIVLNHTFNQSPLAQMYWDAANNRPAADNPWYNAVAPTAFGFGNDFNHESTATKYFFNRVLQHWLNNYKIDGYRFDFSKGLTQKVSASDATFSAYDASRIAIIEGYQTTIKTASPNAYLILEHFCDNSEEKELANNGMMPWGNGNYNYNQATMGYATDWDFTYSSIYNAASRGWTQPNLLGYMESHDEERLMYKNEKYGNVNGSYNVKDTATGLKRNGMAAAFWSMIPGPKMMWEFGELGYDYSRCYLSTNGEGGDCNKKLDPKPIRWDYYNNTNRKALYNVYANLIKLRTTPAYLSTFTTGAITSNLSGAIKWLNVSDNALKVVVYGNFGVTSTTATVTFPSTGTWYSYLNDSVAAINSTSVSVTLPPGAYYVFTSKDIVLPINLLSFTAEKSGKQAVQLKWSTSNEINNQYFEIQRSSNGTNFTTIGKLNALINSSSVKQYNFTDAKAGNINYYRLKQVDINGQAHYSAIIRVSFNGNVHWQVYPNPANAGTALYVQDDVTNLQLTLSDASGKILYRNTLKTAGAGQQVPLPVTTLAKGMYLLKVQSDKGSSTEKIILQ
ncbi:T9SS type A sorting domain-containing protein [Panacibacter ginsenosidivorans]|uniref:T9SS type A sorting domain-containing protein n=1 Tax=Panacibacter ginsenosidivorans TaxID=1813871 RepID=A0A5B8VAI8_9BACT|nr:alpha-amylase family glycosyl hydrolase [Panacibacter ginsenosidivorans]QEC67318.1 T9SS type A sorting domain-containing protein [Panacibacter ginsenosidivorans]